MMKTWTLNRRGFTLCAVATLLLLLLATTSFFFNPADLASRLQSHQHTLNQGPAEIPLASQPTSSPDPPPRTHIDIPDPEEGAWSFDVDRDQRNFGLSEEECSVAFPDFFYEVERAVTHRLNANMGKITPEDVDINWRKDEIMRLMVYDKQV